MQSRRVTGEARASKPAALRNALSSNSSIYIRAHSIPRRLGQDAPNAVSVVTPLIKLVLLKWSPGTMP